MRRKMRDDLILEISKTDEKSVSLKWNSITGAKKYEVWWSDTNLPTSRFALAGESESCDFCFFRSTHAPYYFKVIALSSQKKIAESKIICSRVVAHFDEQLEKLNRGLIAVKTKTGIFLSWRLFKGEVMGYTDTGLSGVNFAIYKNSERITTITDSTNFLDKNGGTEDFYSVAPIFDEIGRASCRERV